MRASMFLAGAALLTIAASATPVSAAGTASGSCGSAEGEYGRNNLSSALFPGHAPATPALYFQVDYTGVEAPTTIGVIVRRNDELEDQAGVFTTTATSPSGSYRSSIVGSFAPTGGPELNAGTRGSRLGNRGDYNRSQGGDDANNFRAERQNGERTSPYTGVVPGLYVFYVYTGEIGPPPAGRFVADERSFLGRFECGVADE